MPFSRRHSRFALAAIIIVVPLAVWAALPLGEDRPDMNRNVEPIGLAPEVKATLALAAWAILLVALGALLAPAGRASTRRADVRVAIPLAVLGAYVAVTYNVMTQPVSGANIGGGIMFLFGWLLVPAMLLLSVWRLWQVRSDGINKPPACRADQFKLPRR